MKDNTPPMSPNPVSDGETDHTDGGEEDIDIGDIEEVIELDDNTDLNEVADRLLASSEARQQDDDDNDGMEEGAEGSVDMASFIFTKHKGSVFTCCLSSDGCVAASGGEDDLAYVWDTTSGDIILTCTGHKDSVTQVCFSRDGTLLATGDYSGYIQVWKVATNTKIWEFEVGDLGWLTWHHGSHVLLAGTTEGEMWMWLIPQGNTRTFPSHGAPSLCGAFMQDGKRGVSGYEDGSVRVFDLKGGQMLQQISTEATTAVVSLAVHKDNTLVIAGSVDGSALLMNANSGKVLGSLNCVVKVSESEEDEADHTVESVSFCPVLPNIAVTATLAGFVTFWDISSQVSRHMLSQGCGSSQLAWHPSEPYLFTAGLDGAVYCYDVRAGEPRAKYTGHGQSVLDLDISRDGSVLLSASDDGTVRVFKLSES